MSYSSSSSVEHRLFWKTVKNPIFKVDSNDQFELILSILVVILLQIKQKIMSNRYDMPENDHFNDFKHSLAVTAVHVLPRAVPF